MKYLVFQYVDLSQKIISFISFGNELSELRARCAKRSIFAFVQKPMKRSQNQNNSQNKEMTNRCDVYFFFIEISIIPRAPRASLKWTISEIYYKRIQQNSKNIFFVSKNIQLFVLQNKCHLHAAFSFELFPNFY